MWQLCASCFSKKFTSCLLILGKLVCIHPSTREGRLAPGVAFLPRELFPSCWLFVISWVCELGINCSLGETRLGSLKLSCPLVIAPNCPTAICKLPGVNAALLTLLWILRPSFHFDQKKLSEKLCFLWGDSLHCLPVMLAENLPCLSTCDQHMDCGEIKLP